MLFGQSIFQSVLDRLEAEDAENASEPPAMSHRIQGLNSSFAADMRDGVSASSARAGQAYLDNLDLDAVSNGPAAAELPEKPVVEIRVAEPPVPPVMPPHLARIAPEAVAAELAISSKDTLHTLSDKRRAFAKVNHPDGIDPLFRDNATTRMKIANLLIDEAIRRIGIQSRLFR